MIKLGVLISGSGTNLQAIIDAIAAGSLDAQVVLVLSSRPDAQGLARAGAAGIPPIAFSREAYHDPLQADVAIAAELKRAGAEYVVMAGYMRKVGAPILDAYPDRVLNIHPALLPSFAGAHGIADAYNHGVKITGVTVHFANAIYDEGPIIAQRAVPIQEQDTLETLEARIHEVEHELYPQTLQLLAQGRVHITPDHKVHISEQ
jgi:phosphoribosylglycinamide formyltransferase-1